MRDRRPTALEACLREAGVRPVQAAAITAAVDRLRLKDMSSDDLAAALWLARNQTMKIRHRGEPPTTPEDDPNQLTLGDILTDYVEEG